MKRGLVRGAAVGVVLLFVGFPIYWMLVTAIDPPTLSSSAQAHLLPRQLTLTAFAQLFGQYPFGVWMRNSLAVAVASTILAVIVGTLAAYSLSRLRYPARGLLSGLFFFVYLFPATLLYCAGHLFQAAVAHYRATGKTALLDVATRFADQIARTFGPGIRAGTGGHAEIEMALVELYRGTGRGMYLDRAGFFLDQRGQQPPVLTGLPYHQDHLPVRDQDEIVGHAVMAVYLACGMADVYAETGDRALRAALERLWTSAYTRKAYVTGGLGSRWLGETLGDDYELPNERAYAETCAAVGAVMWNWRMLAIDGEARFADALEVALYNGALAGIALDGTGYFYQNPLADRGRHRRQPWFECACCPPNIARLLLSLGGYLYSTSVDGLWIHLYAGGSVDARLPNGARVEARVETRYPWAGAVRLVVDKAPAEPWTLFLRVPAWCDNARLSVNGRSAEVDVVAGQYAPIRRVWQSGDDVELELAMPVRRLTSQPWVLANTGREAFMRGPLVYCLEAADHPDVDVWDLRLPADARLTAHEAPDLLGGVVVLRGQGLQAKSDGWAGRLYAPTSDQPMLRTHPAQVTAIPYYAWANREPGPMQVWLRTQPEGTRP